jgi:hypothetical protein
MNSNLTIDMSHDKIHSVMKNEVVIQFNSLLGKLLRNLMTTYPKDKVAFRTIYNKALLAMNLKVDVLILAYWLKMNPVSKLFFSDSMFETHSLDLDLFEGVDMKANWNVTPDETKTAIWSYIKSLFDLSVSYRNIDTLDLDKTGKKVSTIMNKLQEKVQDLKKKKPQSSDDISEYSEMVAKELGVDLGQIANMNIDLLEKQIKNMSFDSIAGAKLNKQTTQKLAATVIQQLKNMQRRHRLGNNKKNVG